MDPCDPLAAHARSPPTNSEPLADAYLDLRELDERLRLAQVMTGVGRS